MKINSNYELMQTRPKTSPNFKRNWQEHVSWGARYVKETGKANFKLFTFPDAKAVFVEVAKKAGKSFGNIKERIVQIFAVQGAAFTINQMLTEDNNSKIYPMQNNQNGVFEAKDIETEENAQYRYIVVDKDDKINLVKDPYAKKQPDINGWSEIYNPDNYEWKALDWLKGKDSRRITRQPDKPLRGLENLIIEEINIPTLSQEGTFEKAKAHIDKIAQKGIATAIEIMPVENCNSLQWGYDGVDKFAVNEKMGSAAQLKELIDYAHKNGLNVIMDMVPNHIGPDGNYLKQTGPYMDGSGDWGDLYNYENDHNTYVRDYMVNAALWWIDEFKVDGLRLDMTQRCKSDWLLKQINEEIHKHKPDAFVIAEDAREDNYIVTAYDDNNLPHDEQLEIIDDAVDIIVQNKKKSEEEPKIPNIPLKSIGFDSEWDFKLMHAIVDTYIDNKDRNLDDLDYHIKNSRHKTKYAMSHDEIGNKDGTRLIAKIMNQELGLYNKVRDISGVSRGHTAAHLSHKLAELCSKFDIENMDESALKSLIIGHGFDTSKRLNPHAVQRAFNTAKAQHKLAQGTVLTIPGPKMFFQGDDEMDLTRFKFFREFSSDKEKRVKVPSYIPEILAEKGYDTLESIARPECILETNNTSSKEVLQFTKDLTELVKNSPALSKGDIIYTYKDYHNRIHTHRLKQDNDEILVIKNFGQYFFKNGFSFSNFPEGTWKEIFNSDSEIYGGMNLLNTERGASITRNSQNLNLAPNSFIILKKV